MIRCSCPECGFNLRGPDELAGTKHYCPKCGQRVLFPGAPPVAQVQAAPPLKTAVPVAVPTLLPCDPDASPERKRPRQNLPRRGVPTWLVWVAGGLAAAALIVLVVALASKKGGERGGETGPAAVPAAGPEGKGGDETVRKPAPAEVPRDSLPQTVNVRFEGRNAEEWNTQLQDISWRVANQASTALANIGPEGLRFFLAGMKSDRIGLRHICVRNAPWDHMAKYKEVFLPVLVGLLADPDDRRIREEAARKLKFCGFKEALPALREARDKEQAGEARGELLEALDWAISGLEKK
jgi:hypothetical protein